MKTKVKPILEPFVSVAETVTMIANARRKKKGYATTIKREDAADILDAILLFKQAYDQWEATDGKASKP